MKSKNHEGQLYLSPELEPLEQEDLLEMLLKHDKLKGVGEGANGVVFKMDLSELDEREINAVRGAFPDLSINDNSSRAVKLLKIYSKEKAQSEMRHQNMAKEIIEAPDSPLKGKVSIPQADQIQTTRLNDLEIIEYLTSSCHVNIDPKYPKANFIIMDFIEGQTLEEIESRQILMNNRKKLEEIFTSSNIEELISSLKGEELRRVVNMVLGQSSKDEFIAHCDMLGDELKGKQVFSKETCQNIKKAIELLHEHGFYHRDLHLGNIMIGKDGIIYIIDFDQAIMINPNDQEEVDKVYNVEINLKKGYRKRKLADNWMVKHLEQVTQDKEDMNRARRDELEGRLLSNIISRANKLWGRFLNTQGDVAGRNVEDLANAFARSFATPGLSNEYSEYLVSGLIALSKAGRTKECVEYALEKLQDKNTSERETNLLNYLIEYIS